jgi:hypothetical protein
MGWMDTKITDICYLLIELKKELCSFGILKLRCCYLLHIRLNGCTVMPVSYMAAGKRDFTPCTKWNVRPFGGRGDFISATGLVGTM